MHWMCDITILLQPSSRKLIRINKLRAGSLGRRVARLVVGRVTISNEKHDSHRRRRPWVKMDANSPDIALHHPPQDDLNILSPTTYQKRNHPAPPCFPKSSWKFFFTSKLTHNLLNSHNKFMEETKKILLKKN